MTQADDPSKLERGDGASEAPPSYRPQDLRQAQLETRPRWKENSHACFVVTAIVCVVVVIGLAVGLAKGIKH
ncbi:hypothetical protein AURDEDRAFT_163838 [Auricularia subglabra TFB-10046 SS5]|nr:hypothetical protein AURDEDRAFT_163838 [Auricularia subglabra TFB-10046 SS5]